MSGLELLKYLLSEEQQPFLGWDFSYLNGRWESELLSWNYTQILNNYRSNTEILLDMGTGGGEFILNLGHPYHLISVTEGWQPNFLLCKERLEHLGITVKYVLINFVNGVIISKLYLFLINLNNLNSIKSVV